MTHNLKEDDQSSASAARFSYSLTLIVIFEDEGCSRVRFGILKIEDKKVQMKAFDEKS
jgi:hypothetical protein